MPRSREPPLEARHNEGEWSPVVGEVVRRITADGDGPDFEALEGIGPDVSCVLTKRSRALLLLIDLYGAAVAGATALAARHLNVPVLMRVGMLALQVRSDTAARAADGTPSWHQLFQGEAATWTLPEAVTVAELLNDPALMVPAVRGVE